MSSSLRSVIPVWIAALAGAIVVGLVAPEPAVTWVPVVMAAVILLTFAIQLGLSRKEGLVSRIVLSLAGALVILVVATGVLGVRALTTITVTDSCACTKVATAR